MARSSLALENTVIHPYALQIHPSNSASQDLREWGPCGTVRLLDAFVTNADYEKPH